MTKQPIKTSYGNKILQWLLLGVVYSGMASAALWGLHVVFFTSKPSGSVGYAYFVAPLLVVSVIFNVVYRKDIRRSIWTLTEKELVGGEDSHVKITLAEISQISIGVPSKSWLLKSSVWLKSGVVIKVDGNKLMALNLSTLENGEELMLALVERCSGQLVDQPVYSDRELSIFYKLKWNHLLDV
jgi:hypothetical protein